MKKIVIFFGVWAIAYTCSYAQGYTGTVNSLVSAAGNYRLTHTPEKLYLQLDKTNYGINDTLWFKAYLFNASSLKASAISNVVYIELSNESNEVQVRRMLTLSNGLGSGCIALPKRDFPEGSYTIRAYTNWMRNFDESLVYKAQFFVGDLNRYKWLIDFSSAVKDNDAQLRLRLTGTDKRPLANQQVLLGVKQEDGWVLRRDKPQVTSANGQLDLTVSIRNNTVPVYASLHKGSYDDSNEPVYRFPVIYNRPEKADVQFLPEGGYMVSSTPSVVGVKIIGENGDGLNLSGTIINSITNAAAATFVTNAKGMGSFSLTPQSGASYKAVVNLPNGIKKDYPLPKIKPTGTVLNIINDPKTDSVVIKVTASAGLNNNYILLGQSRGLVCYGARVVLTANNTKTLKAPKNAFASGIVRFTLLNDQLATLNERIIYLNQKDNLKITVIPNQSTYAPQDSIALNVQVKDSNNNPVQGAFSMSVINDLQLNPHQNNGNMLTHLLLTDDLKGYVQDPAYYFTDDHNKELDDLLLTQGWTGFDWKDVLQPAKQFTYQPEPNFAIKGKVVNLFDKPVKGANVSLMAIRPVVSDKTQSDEQGRFSFDDLPLADSSAYFINPTTINGKSRTYDVVLDKPEWPVFSKNRRQMPWYVNTDTTILKTADTILINQSKMEKLTGMGNVLQEVVIKEKRVVKHSFNLNGPGLADQVIDDKDIEKVGKTNLLELIKKKVNGIRVLGIGNHLKLYVRANPIDKIIIDGIDASKFFTWSEICDLLYYYTSDDIEGIEVMDKAYISPYYLEFYSIPPIFPVSILEITTKHGDGPFLKKTHGFTMYRPPVLVLPKEFYRPKYTSKNATAALFDQRTTIHWEPNIITNKDGKATVTFYAAGQPATYTIITEGSNMNGNVGSITQNLIIK